MIVKSHSNFSCEKSLVQIFSEATDLLDSIQWDIFTNFRHFIKQFQYTLESGINIGVRLLILEKI